ncbi:MAG: DinB family protein [Sphingobacteriales bacterium JAD_PAG50586_3]|nr:MAG: DinB family protein [Sphingobacteriales bacterium JAD_PAG50586_3]
MMTKTESILSMWAEARTRLTKQLPGITEADLVKKLHPNSNSIGFLLRHIGDVELLFAKNVFKADALQVHAKTVIAQKDTGEWTNHAELMDYITQSATELSAIIKAQTDADWETIIETKEFGKKTKQEAVARIISHTAYHAGQIGIILKYA